MQLARTVEAAKARIAKGTEQCRLKAKPKVYDFSHERGLRRHPWHRGLLQRDQVPGQGRLGWPGHCERCDLIEKNELFGGDDGGEGGVSGTVEFFRGTFDQKMSGSLASRYGLTPDTAPGIPWPVPHLLPWLPSTGRRVYDNSIGSAGHEQLLFGVRQRPHWEPELRHVPRQLGYGGCFWLKTTSCPSRLIAGLRPSSSWRTSPAPRADRKYGRAASKWLSTTRTETKSRRRVRQRTQRVWSTDRADQGRHERARPPRSPASSATGLASPGTTSRPW